MKKPIVTLAAAMFAAGSMLSSCSSPDQKVENAEQKVQDAKADVKDAKQDLAAAEKNADNDFQTFKNESNEEINANDKRITELRIEIKNEKRAAREKDEKKIAALEKQNHDLREKLDTYHDDGKSDWKEFKTEFKHDLDGIGKAFKDITVRNTK